MPSDIVIARRRGFTLMELLVVVGLIAVLVAIVFVIGRSVTSGAKARLSEDGLRVLDNALTAYIADVQSNPPALAEDPRAAIPDPNPAANNRFYPVADARNMSATDPAGVDMPGNKMLNSAGLFLSQMNPPSYAGQAVKERGSAKARGALNALPTRLSALKDMDRGNGQFPMVTPLDGWGQPMRYVHPQFDGLVTDDPAAANPDRLAARPLAGFVALPRTTPPAQYAVQEIRRNATTLVANPLNAQDLPDSDGGSCVGNRPYFYSAGADGKVGVLVNGSNQVLEDYNADNVYLASSRPSLPKNWD